MNSREHEPNILMTCGAYVWTCIWHAWEITCPYGVGFATIQKIRGNSSVCFEIIGDSFVKLPRHNYKSYLHNPYRWRATENSLLLFAWRSMSRLIVYFFLYKPESITHWLLDYFLHLRPRFNDQPDVVRSMDAIYQCSPSRLISLTFVALKAFCIPPPPLPTIESHF